MKIEKDKVVEVSYELTVEGNVVDTATAEKPLDYIHGGGMLIPRFESEVEGLSAGDVFAFTLTPDEAYGPYDPKKKFDIPRESFSIGGELREDLMQPGKIVPLVNSSGHIVQALIVEVKEDGVTMDFNHPMAGKTLEFKGKVLSVRDATDKELTEGLHGEFLPQDECCCHGHHGDGCCHGEGHHHHGDGECCRHRHED